MKLSRLTLATVLVLTAATFARRGAFAIAEQVDGQPAAARSGTMPTLPKDAPYDLKFIDAMSKHHRSAIEMATMAHSTLQHTGLKKLAGQIPVDQQREIARMKLWRDRWYKGLPVIGGDPTLSGMGADMDMSQMKMMKPGRDYDAMFIDMMVTHHERAVAMSRAALASAEHQEIKTLAQQIIDAQSKEIEEMRQWKASLGPPAPGSGH